MEFKDSVGGRFFLVWNRTGESLGLGSLEAMARPYLHFICPTTVFQF